MKKIIYQDFLNVIISFLLLYAFYIVLEFISIFSFSFLTFIIDLFIWSMGFYLFMIISCWYLIFKTDNSEVKQQLRWTSYVYIALFIYTSVFTTIYSYGALFSIVTWMLSVIPALGLLGLNVAKGVKTKIRADYILLSVWGITLGWELLWHTLILNLMDNVIFAYSYLGLILVAVGIVFYYKKKRNNL